MDVFRNGETATISGICHPRAKPEDDVMLVSQGHFTTGGIEDRIDSVLPPVFRPNVVPRS